jgi:hypothetical protein
MRLPLKGDDNTTKELNSIFESIREKYPEIIKPQIEMKKVNVMLGDGSIIQSETFEPQKVKLFYQQFINSLNGWTSRGVSKSKTDDLNRLYCQISLETGKYHLDGYFGIQYHALPYYKVDRQVIKIQKELACLADNATKTFEAMSTKGNSILQKELGKVGYADMGFEELFAKLFEDQKLAANLEQKVSTIESQFPEFEEIRNRKHQLFVELDNLLIEVYQISPVYIDYNKLMQGEEGVVTYFDLEVIKNKTVRDSYINAKAITMESKKQIILSLNQIIKALEDMRY